MNYTTAAAYLLGVAIGAFAALAFIATADLRTGLAVAGILVAAAVLVYAHLALSGPASLRAFLEPIVAALLRVAARARRRV